MELLFAENIKKLRSDRNLTQNELAGFLGVSPQSVSKWERNEGYPDITLLPTIATYFSVSVDDLIGKPLASKDEKIKMYTEEYERLRMSDNMDAAVSLARQAYGEYPYEWYIITIYCNSLTRAYTQQPVEKLPELRSLCKMVIDKCTDAEARKFAVYCMLFAEDDDKVDFWLNQVPGTYDFTCWERREERYRQCGQTELYLKQKRENIHTLYTYIDDKLCRDIESPEQGVIVEKQRVDIAKALLQGTGGLFRIAFKEIGYAAALFAVGSKEEGYSVLEESVSLCKKALELPDGTALAFEGVLNGFGFIKKNAESSKKSYLSALKERNDWSFKWLETVRSEERFRRIVTEFEAY